MRRRRIILLGTAALVAVAAAIAIPLVVLSDDDGSEKTAGTTTTKTAGAPRQALPSLARNEGFFGPGGGGGLRLSANRPNVDPTEKGGVDNVLDVLQAQYKLRAFPKERVDYETAAAARFAFAQLPLQLSPSVSGTGKTEKIAARWKELGPLKYNGLPNPFTVLQTRGYPVSGRVTAIVMGAKCVPGNCRMWIGAAGGGVWRTENALAVKPVWASRSKGLTSAAIGSLVLDPNDPTGRTLYAGTGELGGADSEAGTGVFRSTDGGDTWQILAGSASFAHNRGVAGIAVDPRNADTIYVATARSGHGTSSVFGGRAEPPNVAPLGVYQTTDGGDTFKKIYSQPYPGDPTSTRTINQIELDPNDADSLWIAVLGSGVFRRSQKADGDTKFHQVFKAANQAPDSRARLQFALAKLPDGKTRVYLGDTDPLAKVGDQTGTAYLYRVDDAAVPAATLLGTGNNAGWKSLSSAVPNTAGYDSYRYCQEQCWYDNVVASPPGQPDVVWLGGMFNYSEAGAGWSNGRAVVRSEDAGAHFTDLTAESKLPALVLHPDIHALAFSPGNPEIAFIGSDGGMYRTSGTYANASATCGTRNLDSVTLPRCKRWLAKVPAQLFSLNEGLPTLQLQSVSVSPADGELLSGAQDNGTWHYTPAGGWQQTAGGDGGQSGTALKDAKIRFHTWYNQSIRVNFRSGDPDAWAWIAVPLYQSRENTSWYMPFIVDPKVPNTIFVGLEHIWRSKANGGARQVLEQQCTGGSATANCGDWVAVGPSLTGFEFGADRVGDFIAAVERSPGDAKTLWAATLPGRVFITRNADAAAKSVKFTRIDIKSTGATKGTPGRFVSGIHVDPKNPLHAWIAYSGYSAHTPNDLAGHVFEVTVNAAGKATWKNLSMNLGDEPITDIARDDVTGDLYAATDFGVLRLPNKAKAWTEAATGLPVAAVYGLTLSRDGKTLYAATHGRSAFSLKLR